MSLAVSPPTPRDQATARATSRSCAHCGLPVPAPLWDAERGENFCCAGCEGVYFLLRDANLEQYYGFRDQLGQAGRPVEAPPRGRESEFDTPAFQEVYCRRLPCGEMQTEVLLEGVHCAACVWLIERLPRIDPVATGARLNLARSTLTLDWDPERGDLSQVTRTLARLGYRPRPYRAQEAERMRRDELRSLMIRMGVAGAAAGNVMLMAFALYSGDVGFHEAGTMSPRTTQFFEVASLLVSIPALWAGGLFFRGAWSAIRTKTPHMDLPIAIGIAVAFLWGAYGVFWGGGEIYFDTVTALIFFLLVGRFVQRRHQIASADAAELLYSVVPNVARVELADGTSRLLSTTTLELPARVIVRSGEIVPVDGEVVAGESKFDKSLLSGESRPVPVAPGCRADAGSLNIASEVVVLATERGSDTRVAKLMREVEKALGQRTKLVGQADRIAGVFTTAVLLLALVVAFYWSFDSLSLGIERSVALLIVACPCALGLATPLALNAAVSRAARAKMLVFAPEALEQLARPVDLVLDKTGTLTEGAMSIAHWDGDETLAPLVAEAETDGTHPVARALCASSYGRSRTNTQLTGPTEEIFGNGLRAPTSDGELLIGSTRFVLPRAQIGAVLHEQLLAKKDQLTPILIALAGEVRAIAWVGDKIREDAAESLAELKRAGHRLHLLSGDHAKTVESVAQELEKNSGLTDLFASVSGEVSPEHKLARMEALQSGGRPVVMVGDGVNDAGALARADVGIAVKGAAEASQLSADVYLARPGVTELGHLFRGSRSVLTTIRRGIGFSLAYNAVGITCAGFGLIGPLGAAVLMPLSSLTVVTNAYKSACFSGDQKS